MGSKAVNMRVHAESENLPVVSSGACGQFVHFVILCATYSDTLNHSVQKIELLIYVIYIRLSRHLCCVIASTTQTHLLACHCTGVTPVQSFDAIAVMHL